MTSKRDQGRQTQRRVNAQREQRARGKTLREWLAGREHALEHRIKASKERKHRERLAQQADLDNQAPLDAAPQRTVEWLHRHNRPSRPMWRIAGRNRYTGKKNAPYVNPDRIEKLRKSGRLRKELR